MNRLTLYAAAGFLGLAGLYAYFINRDGDSMADDELPPFPALEVQKNKYLAATAGQAFMRMEQAARAAGVSLPISTAWRSRSYQQRLYDAWTAFKSGLGPKAPMAAKPGTSYHEVGLAIDISGIDPAKSNFNSVRRAWLDANAAAYSFYNTGAFFTNREPWHWVYGRQRE